MATLDMTRLKHISKRSIYAVSKYIRDIQLLLPLTENNYYNIPGGIINICILFFGTIYEFDPDLTSDHIKIEDNVLTVTGLYYNYIYFKDIMRSGNGKYEFTMKIKEIATGRGNHDFFFGIKNNTEEQKKMEYWSSRSAPTYFLMSIYAFGYTKENVNEELVPTHQAEIWQHTDSKKKKKYGKYLEKDDIVTMCIDMDKSELRYIINGKDYGVAATFEPGEYRPVLMMFDIRDSVQLI